MISMIFKSNLPSFSFFYKNGMTAVFINGRYMTADEEQKEELMKEVKNVGVHASAHPYIYVDPEEMEIDSEALTPIQLIKLQAKEEARAELLAEQAAQQARAMDPSNVSTTKSAAFADSIATSANIAATLEGESHAKLLAGGPALTPEAPAAGAKLAALTANLNKKA
jgi:hypothetical protein